MTDTLVVSISSDACVNTRHEIQYVEHVQAVVTLTSSRRGDVELILVSPGGTRSTLLAPRLRDNRADGFDDWAFMTTHSWGEDPRGVWKLEIHTGPSACK